MKRIVLVCSLVFSYLNFFCQSNTIDSIQTVLKTSKEDTVRVKLLIELSEQYSGKDYNIALKFENLAKLLSEKLHYTKGLAITLNNIGRINMEVGNYAEANDYFLKAVKISESNGYLEEYAKGLDNIGTILDYEGNYKKSIEYHFQSLKINEKLGLKKNIAWNFNGLGELHRKQQNYEKAREYYLQSLKIFQELARKYESTFPLTNLGLVASEENNYQEALRFFEASLKISEEIGDEDGIGTSYINIGNIYFYKGNYQKAIELLNKALVITTKAGIKDDKIVIYQSLSEIYSRMNDCQKSFEYFKLYTSNQDSLDNSRVSGKIDAMLYAYDSEKKRREEELVNEANNRVNQAELKKQKIIIYTSVAGLLVVLAFSIFIFNRYKLINKQKTIIEEKNKEIMDSIHYAKRIQTALMASDKLLQTHLREHFVLFKPKDIVAGDFYWAESTPDGFIYITADCTGHGVPGAFMSLLNISKLSESINQKQITRPDLILNDIRAEIIQALNPVGSFEESKDGMDTVLCKLDIKNLKLEYASANNSFYIIRKNELIICKADKMPVGKSPKDHELFVLQTVALQKGDIVYTFTDGFADQFGGPKGKKFKYKQLEEVLLANSHLSMDEQKIQLNKAFEDWKGDLEQVDDVLVIGIAI
jgi:tetratricopeptide (TPR) repeat protein